MFHFAQQIAPGLGRLSLRTPTLPPATETNTWLISHEGKLLVVEPATPYAPEQEQLLHAIEHRIAQGDVFVGVVLTHHHGDHVGAAELLRERFDVPIWTHEITRERLAGRIRAMVMPGATLLDGAIEVLHTPGHAPGHVCLYHPDHRWMICGDMVASVGTILIDPDDGGDMDVYLRELRRLSLYAMDWLLPAHGDPIAQGRERLEFYIQHRLKRENKIESCVRANQQWTSLGDIVRSAYEDTPVLLWPIAQKSARAHLARLVHLGALEVDSKNLQWRAKARIASP